MTNKKAINIANSFWNYIRDCKWDEARELLANNFEATWPQSNETFKNPDHFIAMNREYSGVHRIQGVDTRHVEDRWDHVDHVITDTFIETTESDGKKRSCFAISFFQIRDDKIIGLKEYWADTYPAPEWRKRWTKHE